jgi:uncharacterized protein YbbC (DUF1343 family)
MREDGIHVAAFRTGLERVLNDCPPELRQRRVGLLTNLTGVDERLRPAVARLAASADLTLSRLFAAEHGLYGEVPAGGDVDDAVDRLTGLPVVSLYGKVRATPEAVAGLDAVLVDLQDIGCRYYTVLGTTLELLAACHAAGVPLFVLDRPNPLGGRIEGNRTVRPGFRSLVGSGPVPIRHGMTLGELTVLCAREAGHEEAVRVVTVEGWHRSDTFPTWGRPWLPSSPNTNAWEMARLYPATCLVEGTNLSEGRGTALPFQQVGAPWLDAFDVARDLAEVAGDGVFVRPTFFVPTSSKHEGAVCQGVMVHLDPRRDLPVMPIGLHLLSRLLAAPGSEIAPPRREGRPGFLDLLAGGDELRRDLVDRRPVADILDAWNAALSDWPEVRRSVSLYPD